MQPCNHLNSLAQILRQTMLGWAINFHLTSLVHFPFVVIRSLISQSPAGARCFHVASTDDVRYVRFRAIMHQIRYHLSFTMTVPFVTFMIGTSKQSHHTRMCFW
jgi:hypothetical protein